jgi:hypothetical protein
MQALTLHNCLYLRNLGQKVSDFGTLLDHVHDPHAQNEKKMTHQDPPNVEIENKPQKTKSKHKTRLIYIVYLL